MLINVSDVVMRLRKDIVEREEVIARKVLAGECKTMEDYKAECGRLKDLRWMRDRLTEMAGRAVDAEDDELPTMDEERG